MNQNKINLTWTNGLLEQNLLNRIVLILSIFLIIGSAKMFGQSISSISPNSGTQGEAITATIVIAAGTMPLPPADAPVQSVTIGSINGTSVIHVSETEIIAVFNIPSDATTGANDVTVTFGAPPTGGEALVMTLTGGFTVTELLNTAPSITTQPKSKLVRLGNAVSLSVNVYGSSPINYQWQKEQVDINGDTNATFTLDSFSASDAGNYRCIVTNDYGYDISDIAILSVNEASYEGTYPIVDTDQSKFFDAVTVISIPVIGDAFYGQDAQYAGNQPSFTNNGDGTVTDNVTGLMWQQSFDHNGDGSIDVSDKLSYPDILAMVEAGVSFAGYDDWRLPSIKEQYSLMNFSGKDISGYEGTDTDALTPFIDKNYFDFNYGDTDAGERLIDVQCASTNKYLPGTYDTKDETVFGVNFADGRIKGYGTTLFGQPKKFNYLLVRGNTEYGINSFSNNGDGTITDAATGLMWMQNDNGEGLIWENALSYAENSEFAAYSDWRLPNAKELQSIVDYTRSPEQTNSAAINQLFNCTEIKNEAGESDYPFYWSGTTHANWTEGSEGAWGAYVCFGRAMGYNPTWTDVHGAGAQRSDPKYGDPTAYPTGNGPQGDAVRIYNYVRLVRDAVSENTGSNLDYNIIDTGQKECYNGDGDVINFPSAGELFFGQDAQFEGTQFSFESDGEIVSDLNTGLMWQQVPTSQDFSWQDAVDYCESLELGGYDDWRMPSAKELFSISDFNTGWPYIDLNYFTLASGIVTKDEQYWSSNYYVGVTVEGGSDAAFGVNHVTGHIKAYSAKASGPVGGKYVRAVRGDEYGINNYADNGDGTITDNATGLMWAQDDDAVTLDWENALSYAENSELANHSDWRLPNVKELQSIVDYSYSPSATAPEKVGPAIDPIFSCAPIKNEAGNDDYGYYWTNTSAPFTKGEPYYYAWYVAFGMAVNGEGEDFHGAGAVRFDTKEEGGPLGEGGERYYNYVRLVRNTKITGIKDMQSTTSDIPTEFNLGQNYPNPFNPSTQITVSIPETGNYTLKIYNILGQEVATLLSNQISAGTHTFNFDASNLTSGIYFYNFSGNTFNQTKKMMLMK